MQTISDSAAITRQLHAGLAGRPRPEEVVAQILALLDTELTREERRALTGTRRGYGYGYGYSLMNDEFERVSGLDQTAALLARLIGARPLTLAASSDPAALRRLLGRARRSIGMRAGRSDFKADRLNRAARVERGIGDLSGRRYNKIFRTTARLTELVATLERKQRLAEHGRFAKSSFAGELAYDAFAANASSAAFVAYYAANAARRSLFIAGPQARAFDAVAELLFARCERDTDTNWFAVAHVFPRADVLERLDDEQRLSLMERALSLLRSAAEGLEEVAVRDDLDLVSLTVRRGNDSSTWNALAGAWNRARDYWIALAEAMGSEALFEAFLPGKVMRLMAADVVYIHGNQLHPDTRIFAALPKPWDVMAGRETCNRALIEAACRSAGLDPMHTGWSAARPRTTVDVWRPTPETVHGVVVNHPELAAFFRKVGVFGGEAHWQAKATARARLVGASA